MSDKAKAVEDKAKTEQELMQEFLKKYQELCDEYKFRLVITPSWIARDDGTWSTTLQTSVGRQPQEK